MGDNDNDNDDPMKDQDPGGHIVEDKPKPDGPGSGGGEKDGPATPDHPAK